MQASGTYLDGRTAQSQPAKVQLFHAVVEVQIPGRTFTFDRDNARLIPPVGSGPWIVELANRARLQFDDDEFGDALAESFGSNRLVDFMERSWRWALVTLVIAAAGTWALLTYGVPVAAERIAFAVPADIDRRLGDESIAVLDRAMFDASELTAAEQVRIRTLFDDIRDDYPDASYFRLEFRDAPAIGANAFAVPGGLVVITDDMIELAQSDPELVSVLAHEIGHLRERHGLRMLLQNSISAIVIASLTGDLSNITAFSATIPTMLMQAKYSRDFEREADDFAFSYMDRNGLNPAALSELLQRLEAAEGIEVDGPGNWISSHPRSEERLPDAED